MKPGSVVVDLAASSGGNCELSENNKVIEHEGVTIIGNSGYALGMPIDASRMYGKNLLNFLKLLIDHDGNLNLDFKDEIIRESCITHNGEIISERVKTAFQQAKH
jgi:NAD(P) transhydrogenase subunit alpha